MRMVLKNNRRVSILKSDLHAIVNQGALDISKKALASDPSQAEELESHTEMKCNLPSWFPYWSFRCIFGASMTVTGIFLLLSVLTSYRGWGTPQGSPQGSVLPEPSQVSDGASVLIHVCWVHEWLDKYCILILSLDNIPFQSVLFRKKILISASILYMHRFKCLFYRVWTGLS